LGAGEVEELGPAETIWLLYLQPGTYYVRFNLYQGAHLQDVKYVFFKVDPPDIPFEFPSGILNKNSFCRKGPSQAFEQETAFYAGEVLKLVGLNRERTWAKVEAEANNTVFRCWVSLDNMHVFGENDIPTLDSPPTPHPCTGYESEGACMDAGCTWHFTSNGPGYCEE
jgi:hypothetical protein